MSPLPDLMLRRPRLMLATAESVTCGRLQARIGAISGASEFFAGGITAYNLDQKARHLGVRRETAIPVNSVSAAVAEQMARGACALFSAEIGLATTGYAEPSSAWAVAEPFAWWAVAQCDPGAAGRVRSGRVDCPGASRTEAQERVAAAAWDALIAWLEEIRGH